MDWSGKTEPERLFFSANLLMSTILQPQENLRSSSFLYMNIFDRRKGRKVTKTRVLIKMSSSRWNIVNIGGLRLQVSVRDKVNLPQQIQLDFHCKKSSSLNGSKSEYECIFELLCLVKSLPNYHINLLLNNIRKTIYILAQNFFAFFSYFSSYFSNDWSIFLNELCFMFIRTCVLLKFFLFYFQKRFLQLL